MTENQRIDYFDVHEALLSSTASISVAECHGLLSGLVCAAGYADPRLWLVELFDDVDPRDIAQAEATRQVQALYEETIAGLNSPDLDFDLLLPDDGESLDERAEALAGWCHGFMSGLGLGGLPDEGKLPDDIRELVLDIGRIANVDFEQQVSGEEDAVAFEEIVEYVRVGVLYMFEEMQPAQEAPSQVQ